MHNDYSNILTIAHQIKEFVSFILLYSAIKCVSVIINVYNAVNKVGNCYVDQIGYRVFTIGN